MFIQSKLVKGVLISMMSLTAVGSGVGVAKAYNNINMPEYEEVEKTDKQALAVDLATSESYEEMMERNKKQQEQAVKKEAERLAKELEEKERKEKEAKEKAKKEEEQRVLAEQEELRLAEEQRILAEQQAQQQEVYTEQVVQEQPQTQAKQEVQAPVEQPQTRTDGFNYNGNHYNLGTWSGGGHLPFWDNTVYQWLDQPSHFLVERQSEAGQTITSLQVGTEVKVSGETYTVYDIAYNQSRDKAYYHVFQSDARMTIQTCATDDAESDLHIYFLR